MEAVNQHLFRGEIRQYWRLIAQGAARSAIVYRKGTSARGFDFGTDRDGMAQRNAGILLSAECQLNPGRYYYRFVGTAAYSQRSSQALLGNWWIDDAVWNLMVSDAGRHGDSLELVAQRYLALPDEWGDRGRVARGRLVRPLMAWRGLGAPAQGRQGSHTPAQHNRAVQLCIPGDSGQIGSAFGGFEKIECIYTRDVIKELWG